MKKGFQRYTKEAYNEDMVQRVLGPSGKGKSGRPFGFDLPGLAQLAMERGQQGWRVVLGEGFQELHCT